MKSPMERGHAAFHLWEINIIFPLFSFSLPQVHRHSYCRSTPAPGCSSVTQGSSKGWLRQTQEPKSSPNSTTCRHPNAPLGAIHPPQCSAQGPSTTSCSIGPIPAGTVQCPREYFPFASSRNSQVLLQAGHLCKGCCGC